MITLKWILKRNKWNDKIKVDFKEGRVVWICVALDRDHQMVSANMAMDFRVPKRWVVSRLAE